MFFPSSFPTWAPVSQPVGSPIWNPVSAPTATMPVKDPTDYRTARPTVSRPKDPTISSFATKSPTGKPPVSGRANNETTASPSNECKDAGTNFQFRLDDKSWVTFVTGLKVVVRTLISERRNTAPSTILQMDAKYHAVFVDRILRLQVTVLLISLQLYSQLMNRPLLLKMRGCLGRCSISFG